MVDRNLFLYELSVTAILKNEALYLREWLDYHLLAGVDHFYLYDNDSTDNQAEVVAPYVEAGLVDYFHAPGKAMQMLVYNDAVKRFKFQSRYIAFLDADEFIYPKSNRSIVEVVDEILLRDPNAAGLGINWQIFGSNDLQTADYTRGVLDRFTRRAPHNWVIPLKENNLPGGNAHVKTIANPRRIILVGSSHCPIFFKNFYLINEDGVSFYQHFNNPVTVEKIAVNHYYAKSREEFNVKQSRGRADFNVKYTDDWFDMYNRNEEFDDGILKYRAARAENFSLENDAAKVQRVAKALNETLSKFANDELSDLETALVYRAASNYLGLKIHEEASLAAILKSLDNLTVADARLLISELPYLLSLPYPVVEDLRGVALQIIQKSMDYMHLNSLWRDYVKLDYIRDFLEE